MAMLDGRQEIIGVRLRVVCAGVAQRVTTHRMTIGEPASVGVGHIVQQATRKAACGKVHRKR